MSTQNTSIDDSALRASLIEIGDAPRPDYCDECGSVLDGRRHCTSGVTDNDNRVPLAKLPPERLESTWTTQVVSDAATTLVAQEQATLATLAPGLADGALLYDPGTAFAAVGWDTVAKEFNQHMELPTAAAADAAHKATIAAEGRRDREIELADWALDGAGMLVKQATAPAVAVIKAHVTANAWGTIVGEAPAGTAVPANLNTWISRAARKTKVARVRSTIGGGEREIYAMVSQKYAVVDSDEIVHTIAQRMPNCRVDLTYDRATTRTRARFVDMAPIDVPALSGVGRVHSLGLDVFTRDDGKGSAGVEAFLLRNRCLNASKSELQTGMTRVRHMGSAVDLLAALDAAIGTIPALIAELRSVWSAAAAHYFLDSESGMALSAPEAIVRLVAGGHLPLCGVSADAAVDMYTAAWRAEDSPQSAAGVVMAVQRAAHEGSWRTSWADETIEAAASELLYQSVYTLDAATA